MAIKLHWVKSLFSQVLAAGFVMVALILIGLLVASSLTVRQLRLIEVQAEQSLKVVQLVSNAEDTALRVRLHTRGYVITGNDMDAEQARQQARRLQDILEQLRAQVQPNTAQLERVRQLEQILAEGKTYLEDVITLRRTDRESALSRVPGPDGDALAQRISLRLDSIEQEAQTNFEQSMVLARKRAETLEWLIIFSVSVVLLLLVATYRVVTRELSERRRLMLQLEHARDAALTLARKKSDFLANMSHEIRTPMNGIMGTTELLLRTPLNTDQRNLAETIRYSADALLAIVNDILDFSKVEAGKLTIEASEFDLRATVEQSVETLAAAAREKSLELVTLVYRDVPEQLRGDAGRIRQVLLNLVGNAIKFTDKGEVVVRVTKQSETDTNVVLRFSVTDTGMGIPKEARVEIFEAFTQLDSSQSRRFSGTGLGLAISKRLVNLMGGEIGVESEVGKGSVFWFTIALEKVEAGQPPSTYELWFGIRTLVVDDNATNRTVIAQQLTDFGLFCEVVASAQEALAALREAAISGQPFRVAILDSQMPTMDGLSLVRQIHAEGRFTNLACILLTTPPVPAETELAQIGVAACVTKPVRIAALKEALRQVLSKPRPKTKTTPTRQSVPPAAQATGGDTNCKLILLVEDNPVNQQVAQRMLEALGYRVTIAATGMEALSLAQAQPPDAILMDCQLPEMDGYTATMHIREQERLMGRHVPIIALTANALQGERERCLAAGMDDYLCKPFKLAELEQVLASCLGEKRTSEDGRQEEIACPADAEAAPDGVLLDTAAFQIGTGFVATNQASGELARQIIATFQSDVATQLRQMELAIAQQDERTVRTIAHRLRGSAAQLGARRLAYALRRIEETPDSTDWLQDFQTVEAIAEATRAAFDDALHLTLAKPSERQTQSTAS